MGYGNPLFDGDHPLPVKDRPAPRILSLRLWLGAVLAGTLGDGASLADRHDDEGRHDRGAESQWRQGEWDGRS